ncbi:MAG: methionyl-tRNA formyltransferase [Alphaproteobacteria bacterium]
MTTCTTRTATQTTGYKPMRLVFMGTPAFALPTLKALVDARHDIAAVYTQPPRPAGRGQKDTPSPVHNYAQENNIPVYTPASLKGEDEQKLFAAHNAEAAVVVAYGLLLPKPILDAYPMGCINVHPSALPRWRGAAPIQRSIMAGDTETGICIMQMDEGLDTGDILIYEKEFLPDFIDAGGLHDMLAAQAGSLVLLALEGLKNGSIIPQKQSEDGVTYAKKISKEECHIDWNKPAEEIYNHIRSLSPSPGAYFIYNGEKIKIFSAQRCTSDKEFERAKAGQVISKFMDIKCGKGILMPPYELQRPGKKRMGDDEFLQGFPIPPGSILE